ncbi:hypothetical protein [Sediminibacterium ginsengisoli]|uniref:Dynamin family protein n=1 Tax=Sediminibacterium ginsengisoli TaxID=413434 RepID=A0A1T4KN43_9BACT|nr:hypothetical protein [Sediminibacterium ginsengisoli]SJZ43826.1 hypothetical protein SAMN04488132_10222 [Sediminibacterium ginsengisoli]
MRELNYIAERFEDLMKELPVSGYAGFLDETKRKIKQLADKEAFYIDVFCSVNASSESRKLARQLEETSSNSIYRITVKHENNYSVRVFQDVFPTVGIILLDEEMQKADKLIQYFRRPDTTYRLQLVVNLLQDQNGARDFTRQFRSKAVILTPENLEGKTTEDIIKTAIEDTASIDKMKKIAYLNSIKPVFSFLDEILSAENKSAQTRKLLHTQNTNITRKEEQSMNNSEVVSNLRQLIQKSAQELEKSYKLKYEDLNKPNTGQFSIITAQQCGKLEDFERKSLAEKSEKYETSIAEDFLNKFTGNIAASIRTELGKDEAFIKSSFEDLIAQINIQLKNKGIQPLKADTIYPPFPEKERTIQSFCYMNKTYSGEIIKKGAMEYFVALRDYTGLIMVVGGLLAPLSIVASASESGIFKHIATWVKASTAGISLLMIVYGIYDLRRRIPKKRIEEFERELGKAKDLLQQESKRMFNDSSRDWTSNISNWMRDTTQNINLQIERNIKDLQTQRTSQMNQEKNQLQKQQQSVEMLLRSIQSAERVKDQLNTRYREMVTEAEKDLKI